MGLLVLARSLQRLQRAEAIGQQPGRGEMGLAARQLVLGEERGLRLVEEE